MTVNLIAAVGHKWKIGLDGALPWRDRADLSFFRKMTSGGIVIVGARAFKTLPALPGRDVYVWERGIEPADMVRSLKEWRRPIWIAGGAATYRAFAPQVDGLRLINLVDYDGPADTFFPADAYGLAETR